MNDIIIAEAVRSAVGRGHKGSLSNRRPDELAADVLRGLIARVWGLESAVTVGDLLPATA